MLRREKSVRRILIAALAGVAIAGAYASAASASIIYSLDVCKATGGCVSAGPYGTVSLTDDGSGNVNVEVKLAGNEAFASTGAGASLLWDLTGSPTISITGLTTGFMLESTTAGTIHADGTGDWMYAIDCTGCGSGGSAPQLSGPLDFTITGESAADFTQNGNKFYAASDICFGATGTGCGNTGDVASDGADPPASVPEPSPLALMGAGLLALVIFRPRKAA